MPRIVADNNGVLKMTDKEFMELSNLSILSVEIHQVFQKLDTVGSSLNRMNGAKKEVKCAMRAIEELGVINEFIKNRYVELRKKIG